MRGRVLGPLAVAGLLACTNDPTGVSDSVATQLKVAQAAADSVRAANGRVFIGFKEAGQVRGVDPQGRVLVSTETVFRMTSYLRDQGITIEIQYSLPAVVGHIPLTNDLTTVVRQLRSNPNIDYVEPIYPGTRF